jgi:hypothetical protein
MGKPLHFENWFYHTFHLADQIEDASDCLVCEWYRQLLPSTQALTECELGVGANLGTKIRTRVKENQCSGTISM